MKLNPCDSSPCAKEEICTAEINSPLGYTCQGSQNTQDCDVLSKVFILREENKKNVRFQANVFNANTFGYNFFESYEISSEFLGIASWDCRIVAVSGFFIYFSESTKNHPKG